MLLAAEVQESDVSALQRQRAEELVRFRASRVGIRVYRSRGQTFRFRVWFSSLGFRVSA